MTGVPLGSVAMLRIAGLPIDVWTAGGAPELFALVGRVEQDRLRYERAAAVTADRIGSELVPDPTITNRDRAAALRLRRALHNGVTALPDVSSVTAIASDDLAADLGRLVEQADAVCRGDAAVHDSLAAEEGRLLGLPWRLLLAGPVGRHAVRAGDIAVGPDIADRLEAAEPWSTKRMRRRGDYLWRMLTRATTRATPRGWLAHVALLPVEPDGWAGGPLHIEDLAAEVRTDNVQLARVAEVPAATLLADPTVQVVMAPLSRLEADHLVVPVLRGGRFTEVRMRRTAVLLMVLRSLANGPVPVEYVLDTAAGSDQRRRDAVLGLLAHLMGSGVLQVRTRPHSSCAGWYRVDHRPAAPTNDGYVDVYRRPAAALAHRHASRLEKLLRSAVRVLEIIDDGSPLPPCLPAGLGPRPRPLLDVLAECLDSPSRVGVGDQHHHDWPPRSGAGPRYRRLLDRLDGMVTEGTAGVDIDESLLDELCGPEHDDGSDPAAYWPMDHLLRPIDDRSGLLAVLDQISPAGVLDARLAQSPDQLGADGRQVRAYREFLHQVEERAGGRFVELLVPPLHSKAANAVRRPIYTTTWTGDPDRVSYFDEPESDAVYLPPAEITVRLDSGRVVAEADGLPIWPVWHTARVAPPPWDTFVNLLRLASPQPDRWHRRPLTYSLSAWPGRDHLPRITVGRSLVLTVAQWRLRRQRLWPVDRPMVQRLTALHRLRQDLGLPRWVTIAHDAHEDPRAVDLESVPAVRMIERAMQHQGDLIVAELLPGPGRLPVHDLADRGGACVAELLLRLPLDGRPQAVAARVADRIKRSPGWMAEGVAVQVNGGDGNVARGGEG